MGEVGPYAEYIQQQINEMLQRMRAERPCIPVLSDPPKVEMISGYIPVSCEQRHDYLGDPSLCGSESCYECHPENRPPAPKIPLWTRARWRFADARYRARSWLASKILGESVGYYDDHSCY